MVFQSGFIHTYRLSWTLTPRVRHLIAMSGRLTQICFVLEGRGAHDEMLSKRDKILGAYGAWCRAAKSTPQVS